MYYIKLIQDNLTIPKGKSETVNRRTDITMSKGKTMVHTENIRLRYTNPTTTEMNRDSPKELTVPAPLATTVVLLLLKTR